MSDLLKKCYNETIKRIWSEHSRVREEKNEEQDSVVAPLGIL